MKRKIVIEKCSECPNTLVCINALGNPKYGKYFYYCKEMLGEKQEYQTLSGNCIPNWCPLDIDS